MVYIVNEQGRDYYLRNRFRAEKLVELIYCKLGTEINEADTHGYRSEGEIRDLGHVSLPEWLSKP